MFQIGGWRLQIGDVGAKLFVAASAAQAKDR